MSPAPLGAPIGLGLAGCGVIGEVFATVLPGLPSARLVAVYDIDAEKAAGFAAEHDAASAASFDELLARPDVDVACICAPSGLHAELGLAALRAGKHVVVEKPIDIALGPAQHLVDAAKESGLSLNVISQQRYNPGVRLAKALLDEGRLGRPLFVQARVPWYRSQAYYDSAPWRGTWALDGGGAFMNQGVHYADLLCWLFGAPEVIAAHCANMSHEIEVEDLALALLRFPSGAVGTLVASTLSYPGFPTVLSVNGTEGSLELVEGELVALELKDCDSTEVLAGTSGLKPPDGHRAQLADIFSALLEGRPPPVSGEDGYRALKFVLDVYAVAGWGPGR